ncbi:MAG: glycosyltransferase family 9 protein [Chitinivibrionales bacterium]
MPTLYDKILHGKFTGAGGAVYFTWGLKLRSLFFKIRDIKGRLLYRPKRQSLDLSRVSRIVLIRTDRIGDIILSTPALKALRARYPNARIDYVVQEKYAALLNCYEGWNTVIKVDISNPKQLKATGKLLKSDRYDVAVVMHPAKYAYQLARATKASWIIGWRAKGFGFLLTHGFDDDRGRANRHQVENNLRLFSPLGVLDNRPSFPIKETQSGKRQYARLCEKYGLMASDRVFAVHPGSYSPRVRWMPERFGALVDKAHGAGLKVVLLGGKGDETVIEEVLKAASLKPIVAINELDFEGLVSFFIHTLAFVGNSTGPMHIAASAGTWTIAVFGNRYPMDRWELWKPWGPKGIVVTSKKYQCSDCTPWTCAHMECLSSVTVDDVWNEVSRILSNN